MLSLIISIAFISISSKLYKNIKLNNYLNTSINKKNILAEKIAQSGGLIEKDEFLTFEQNSYIINKEEEFDIIFEGNSNFSGKIVLTNGGPIVYEVKSYSGADNSYYNITSSGIIREKIANNFNGILNNSYDKVNLKIKNLGGISKIIFETNNDNFHGTGITKKYKIEKKIGGKYIEKTIITK
ncbi:MAG: hypothetical protein PHN31_03760 [Candidatus Gracilibacteria bacterium]|nr:hypothetical protein [Candidatus Gracilibacteria bacterium]